MSTHSLIAKPTEGGGFTGVYCHFDGYPDGVGRTLHALGQRWGAAEVIRVLIDTHPAGWSSIANADWDTPPAERTVSYFTRCATCGRVEWRHYKQYYADGSPYQDTRTLDLHHGETAPTPEPGAELIGPACVYAHPFRAIEVPRGPECYPAAEAPAQPLTDTTATAEWCEYAYVIHPERIAIYEFTKGWQPIGMAYYNAPFPTLA